MPSLKTRVLHQLNEQRAQLEQKAGAVEVSEALRKIDPKMTPEKLGGKDDRDQT